MNELVEKYPSFDRNISLDVSYMSDESTHPPIERCYVTEDPISEMKEYQINAYCFNDKQLSSGMVFGESFLKDYEKCLSDETLEFLDDFFNSVVDLPPSLKSLLEDKVFVL